jgi:peroxiredoxin
LNTKRRVDAESLLSEYMAFNVGNQAPDFTLPNAHPSVGSPEMNLQDVMGERGAIVVFSCLHCPYVVGNIGRIEGLAQRAGENGLGFVAINSNAANPDYASDSAQRTTEACERGVPYPFLIDTDQSVSKAWGAERTPEFYLLDGDGSLMYRGRYDDSPTNPQMATTSDMMDALDQYLAGESVQNPQTDSIGCSVKWIY